MNGDHFIKLFCIIILWCLFINLISVDSSATNQTHLQKPGELLEQYQNLDLNQRISELVDFAHTKQPYRPTTLRFIGFQPEDENILITWSKNTQKFPALLINGNSSEILMNPEERKKKSVKRFDLFTHITLVVIQNQTDFNELLLQIKMSVDPRRDFVIFITTEALISKLRKLQGLREKLILDINSPGVWVEPITFNGDMIKINKIEQIEIANPMGANLRGRTLRASAPETPPFNYKAGEDSKGQAIVEGSLCKIFVEASYKFNYTYFIKYEGYDYGTLHKNGTWTGSYSKVHYPDSGYDMDLIVSSELLWTQVDVASLATYIDMMFGVAHPVKPMHWYAFLLPFDPQVWALSVIMFFFLGVVQGIVMYFMQGRQLKPIVIDATSLLPFSITMEQGLQDIPKGMRYFSLILLMGCMVLGTGYKSTLRTHLMFPKPDPVPVTFDELADRTDYGVTLTVNGALEKHFWATSEVRAVKKIRERLTFENDWGRCYKKAFLNKKMACVSWVHGKAVVAKTMTLNTTVEPLLYSKDAAIRKFLSLGFQKDSIYVDSFSRITGTPASMGIVSKWEDDIWTNFKKMGRKKMLNETESEVFKELIALAAPEEDAVPLQVGSLVVVLGLVPAGGILGSFAFCFEKYRFSKIIKEQKNDSNKDLLKSPDFEIEKQIESIKVDVLPAVERAEENLATAIKSTTNQDSPKSA